MKNTLFFLFLLISISVFSQENANTKDSLNSKSVPLYFTEKVPTYSGCIGDNKQRRACLNNNIRKFIGRSFDAEKAKCLKFEKKYDKRLKREVKVCKEFLKVTIVKIKTTFVIDTIGKISDVSAVSPYPTLNEEAVRVLKSLPYIEPGEQLGRKVKVRMSIPIQFRLQ